MMFLDDYTAFEHCAICGCEDMVWHGRPLRTCGHTTPPEEWLRHTFLHLASMINESHLLSRNYPSFRLSCVVFDLDVSVPKEVSVQLGLKPMRRRIICAVTFITEHEAIGAVT
jgi:hypothetical protein